MYMIFNYSSDITVTHSFDEGDFNQLTTVTNVTGDKLPTIYGSGYITLRRIGVGYSGILNVFIDDNTVPFTVYINSTEYGVKGDFLRFYFQEKISFSGGLSSEAYFYQTLLADKPVNKKYNIIQGKATDTEYITVNGKGKILVSPTYGNPAMFFHLDGGDMQTLIFYGYQYMEYQFNNSFKFKASTTTYPLYYIIYTEIEF